MKSEELNHSALEALYEALGLCLDTMCLNQDMCHESYDIAVEQARAAIALAESPAEQCNCRHHISEIIALLPEEHRT